jgi:hypothetical protein
MPRVKTLGVFFGSRPSAAAPPADRAQEGQWLPRQREPFFLGLVLQRLRRFRIELRRSNSTQRVSLRSQANPLISFSVL